MAKTVRRIFFGILHQKYLWTIVFFVAIVGFVDENSFWHRHELRMQNEELRQQIQEYTDRFNDDTHELEELEHNPDAVERVARVNLYMKTADEDVYVIEGDKVTEQ